MTRAHVSAKLSNFYVKSSVFTLLSIGGAIFNYALYPILAHVLSTSSFGDFTVILALSNQIFGIMLTFNLVSIYLVKIYSEDEARHHAQTIQKVLVWFFLSAILLTILSSPVLKNILHIHDLLSFVILAVILLMAIPVVVWTGYLQGNKMLIAVGAFNLFSSLAKFILVITLAMWLGPTGGLLGVVLGTGLGLVVLRKVAKIKLPEVKSVLLRFTQEERNFLHSIKLYVVEAIFIVGGLSFLQNYDITLAKNLFNSDVAGIYSGISVLSNALYYLSFLLIWIILPEIRIGDGRNNHRIMGTAYKLLGALVVVAVIGELLLKDIIPGLLLGHAFRGQGNLLLFATLYQLSLVSVTLYAFYLLVSRKKKAVMLSGLVVGGVLVVPAVFASTALQMITEMWLSLIGAVVLYGLLRALLFNNQPSVVSAE
jgi:O-antigen/teichoic acid export membrane protein